MSQYLVTYDDGSELTLNVERLEYDGEQYVAYIGGHVIAYIRPLDVRSIVRQGAAPDGA